MKIRTGTAESAPEVLRLLDEAVAWLAGLGRTGQWGDQPFSSVPRRVEHVHGYFAPDCLPRLAEAEDGTLLGACVLSETLPSYATPIEDTELYVRLLVTSREHSGSGIGAALIADAVEETRRRGHPVLRLDCYAGDDRRLVGQYQRLGFTPTDTFTVEQAGKPWPGQLLEIRV
ncbi:acetyltransferase [Kitasatospora sp. MMS16-BH015]|uniref:GNAT family N-acetyltransferase n=1 Tax=Kitasatospora sp. MMS16-BH015 TaxID=2018025 RepID=UPI000CA0DEEA|nr:GNAT family N-acetyltransferase [Kitasatospora sp. MMS16-BH015]AUG79169.1 acetyltransferase [Kitasatospora sp. MMS16-BH015]